MAKKSKVLSVGAPIEAVVEALTELDYVYLDGSDFVRRMTICQSMSRKPYKCYFIRNNRINLRTIEELCVWNPTGKVFCELRFDSEGLSEISSTAIGKNQYNGSKALSLAENNIMLEKTR